MSGRGASLTAVLLAAVLAGCASPGPGDGAGGPGDPPTRPGFPSDATLGTTRLFAKVGAPGYPEGLAVDGDVVYVSSTARDDGAGAIFVHDLATGALLRTIAVAPAEPGGISFVVGLALDTAGRVYAAEAAGANVLRIDPRAEPPTQEIYAALPDLPRCTPVTPAPCSPTATDDPPFPNQPAFGPDGALYVSDSLQATVFRVPPGGGAPEAWFQDARFDVGFGANGIALSPDDRFVYVAQSAIGPVAPSPTGGLLGAGGALWRVPLDGPGSAEMVARFAGGLPDGFAVAASGRIYVTIIDAGVRGHGIAVLDPDGREAAFFPTREENAAHEVPYHEPASVAFVDAARSILVTNQAFTDPSRWAVLEAFVDETGAPLHRPG